VSLVEDVRRLITALTGAAWALIGFLLTQTILKFFIEPILEQRQLIGEVALALSIYADIENIQREGVDEARRNLRSLSGRLWASLWTIPFYDAFGLIGVVPKRFDVMNASTSTMLLSHTLTSTGATIHRVEIANRLGILP
jgi:hypothetical protein